MTRQQFRKARIAAQRTFQAGLNADMANFLYGDMVGYSEAKTLLLAPYDRLQARQYAFADNARTRIRLYPL